MRNNLVKLYNTMLMIETKGENTKIMADCLRFVQQLIEDEKKTTASDDTKSSEA